MFRDKNGIVNTSDYAIFNYLALTFIGFLCGQGLLQFSNITLWMILVGAFLIIVANISLCFCVYVLYLRKKSPIIKNR